MALQPARGAAENFAELRRVEPGDPCREGARERIDWGVLLVREEPRSGVPLHELRHRAWLAHDRREGLARLVAADGVEGGRRNARRCRLGLPAKQRQR
ncbi:hypothetical protein ACFQE0_26775 [Methylobacterium komagatae]|uniref:DUF2934 domain-containing protein n=1 Tax=Methylobacterium komagatae TaxID=374425 RepID=A0ABW2BRH9_9HYPH